MFFGILQNIFIEIRFLGAIHLFLGIRIPRHWIFLEDFIINLASLE